MTARRKKSKTVPVTGSGSVPVDTVNAYAALVLAELASQHPQQVIAVLAFAIGKICVRERDPAVRLAAQAKLREVLNDVRGMSGGDSYVMGFVAPDDLQEGDEVVLDASMIAQVRAAHMTVRSPRGSLYPTSMAPSPQRVLCVRRWGS